MWFTDIRLCFWHWYYSPIEKRMYICKCLQNCTASIDGKRDRLLCASFYWELEDRMLLIFIYFQVDRFSLLSTFNLNWILSTFSGIIDADCWLIRIRWNSNALNIFQDEFIQLRNRNTRFYFNCFRHIVLLL